MILKRELLVKAGRSLFLVPVLIPALPENPISVRIQPGQIFAEIQSVLKKQKNHVINPEHQETVIGYQSNLITLILKSEDLSR